MTLVQRDYDPAPWRRLGETLTGYLAARALGLLASDFVLLDREGVEFGHLEIRGPGGAEFGANGLEARIERIAPASYRMLSSDNEILTSTGVTTTPEIRCLGTPYQTSLSLFRNTVDAWPANREAKVRIKGGLTNRNYEAYFETGEASPLPVALFFLFRLVTLRRNAYRTGQRDG